MAPVRDAIDRRKRVLEQLEPRRRHEANIGFWLNGTGDFGASALGRRTASAPAGPSYLGDASTGFSFTRAADTRSVTVTTRLEMTAYRDDNEFGWFDTTDPATLRPLFFGIGGVGGSVTFIPSGSYGFYLKSPEGTYRSTGAGDARTHFALFQAPNNDGYLVGVEDMWSYSDRDFNDMVFEVQASSVPEPASMVLLGTGLPAWPLRRAAAAPARGRHPSRAAVLAPPGGDDGHGDVRAVGDDRRDAPVEQLADVLRAIRRSTPEPALPRDARPARSRA